MIEHGLHQKQKGAPICELAPKGVTLLLRKRLQIRLGDLPRTAPAEPARRATPRAKHFRDAAVALDSFSVRPLDVEISSLLSALAAET
jgi:hypothetical protein